LALVLWPWNAIVRRHYGRKLEWSREDLRWRMILRAICAVDLIFLSVSVSFLSRVQDPTVLNDRLDTAIHLMQLLGTAGALATLVAVYAVWRSWKYSQRGRWSKLGDTLITLACLGYLFFVLNWHMLNFNLNY
jgi:hypothetical protein